MYDHQLSALPPKADIAETDWHVRFVPKADIARGIVEAMWLYRSDYGAAREQTAGCLVYGPTANQNARRGIGMSDSDVVSAYRLHAANCIAIAQRFSDPKSKLALLDMAQAWLNLAEQANWINVRNPPTACEAEESWG